MKTAGKYAFLFLLIYLFTANIIKQHEFVEAL